MSFFRVGAKSCSHSATIVTTIAKISMNKQIQTNSGSMVAKSIKTFICRKINIVKEARNKALFYSARI